MPPRPQLLLPLAAVLAASLPAGAALARGGHRAAATRDVTIHGYAFHPKSVTIHRGDRVTWLFRDGSIAHNVTGRGFRHSPTKSSGSFTVRFNRRGTYSYTCTLHPWMTGRVVVR